MTGTELRRHIATVGRESWLLFLAITIVNASNYLFHVVISRMLTPDEYGALGAVLAILILLSVPLGAVQTTVAKRLAEKRGGHLDAGSPSDWYRMARTVAILGAGLSLALAIMSPLVGTFLRLDSNWTTLFVAIYVTPALIGTVLRGVLQGELRFKELAFASAFPTLARLAIGIPVVHAGGGVAGAVAASVVADCLGVLAVVFLLWRRETPSTGIKKDWTFLREVLPIAVALAAMWLLIELDLILARHFLPAGEAGAYAAAGLLARAVLFVPGAISLVALPHFSQARGRGADAQKWLTSSSALVVGLGTAVALVLSIWGDPIISLTFGARFSAAASLLPTLSLAMVGMGLANLLVFFHIAAGSRIFHLLWPLCAIEAGGVALTHGSGETIALVVLVVAWVAAGLGLYAARTVAISPSRVLRLPETLLVHSPVAPCQERPELSLVIPTYNGGSNLLETVRATVDVLEATGRTYQVIVVSDGSTDGCDRAVVEAAGSLDVVHYTDRQGKGVALRVGMTRARGKYVAFIDGDGDLDPRDLEGFLKLMELYEPDVVIGSKRHPLSVVEYPAARRAMSWMYQRLVRLLFGLNVRDTQTGMKLIRSDVLEAVLPRMLEKRFAFDLEFLVVAKRLGHNRFFEAPVKLNYRFGSTVSPRAVLSILLDTGAIFYRRYILRFYDFPGPGRPVDTAASATQLSSLAERPAEL